MLKRFFVCALILLCFGAVTASAAGSDELTEGTYYIDSSISCYINAMGGIEFADAFELNTMTYRFKTSVLKLLDHYTPQEQVVLLKKSIALYDVVYECDDNVSALKEKADSCIRIAEIFIRLGNKDEARVYIDKALSGAAMHDTIPYGTQCQSVLSGCEKYGYNVLQSGKLAHPYGKLKETVIASLRSKSIFDDIISDIET